MITYHLLSERHKTINSTGRHHLELHPFHETFQWVWATSNIASKRDNNLLPKYWQPTEVEIKGATIYENDNPFFISTKQQLHFFSLAVTWLSWLDKASMTLLVLYCLLYISCTNIYKNKPSFNTRYKELRIKSCMLTSQSLITSCKTKLKNLKRERVKGCQRQPLRLSRSRITRQRLSHYWVHLFIDLY